MEQLLTRLSNLSYELLGIVLPGLITLVMFVFWLVGIGELLPAFSDGFFPRLTLSNASRGLEAIGVRTGVGFASSLLLITYFLGHLLHWISRKGREDSKVVKSGWRRSSLSLLFRVPKPSNSYDVELQPLLEAVVPKFGVPLSADTWRQFYPIAKNYLARNSGSSLVGLYQNKYTLHRSLVTGAAAIFWLSMLAMCFGIYTAHHGGIEPRWAPLTFLTLGCLTLVWGFSDSYAFNWKMFGNSVITESYSMLFGPQPNAKP